MTEAAAECLGCAYLEHPHDKPVTLCSGREVCNHCPAFRDECLRVHTEAARLLRMSSRDVRRRELSLIESRHGAAFSAKVEAEAMRQWEARRAGAAS
jgi:hypothetical protein